jgi:hypothetical protein
MTDKCFKYYEPWWGNGAIRKKVNYVHPRITGNLGNKGPMKMSLSIDRWQEFLGYQYLVGHKSHLHCTQGLLAMKRIPVNEYEHNCSLNKMTSDFTTH